MKFNMKYSYSQQSSLDTMISSSSIHGSDSDSGSNSDGGSNSVSGSYSDSGDYGGSLSSSAGGGSTPSEPDFTVYPEAPVTAPTGLQVTGLDNTAFMSLT